MCVLGSNIFSTFKKVLSLNHLWKWKMISKTIFENFLIVRAVIPPIRFLWLKNLFIKWPCWEGKSFFHPYWLPEKGKFHADFWSVSMNWWQNAPKKFKQSILKYRTYPHFCLKQFFVHFLGSILSTRVIVKCVLFELNSFAFQTPGINLRISVN
jgi:hypothetical protein